MIYEIKYYSNSLERRKDRKKQRNAFQYKYSLKRKSCDLGCGGEMTWCNCCEMFSNNCCQDYGTCQCS